MFAHSLCALFAALMCAPGLALADVNEHAYALHLSGVGSAGAQVTVDEGSAFGVELLVSVETALADEDEADDELDALAAFVACDSGGRVLQVSGVTWLPGGSGGYGWADFNDDAAIGFDPPVSGYPQDLAPGSPLRLIGMEYPQTDTAGLSVDEVGTGLVLATIDLLAPAIDDPVEVFELSLISAGGQASTPQCLLAHADSRGPLRSVGPDAPSARRAVPIPTAVHSTAHLNLHHLSS